MCSGGGENNEQMEGTENQGQGAVNGKSAL